jgi:hypothetical protein
VEDGDTTAASAITTPTPTIIIISQYAFLKGMHEVKDGLWIERLQVMADALSVPLLKAVLEGEEEVFHAWISYV